MSCSGCKAPIDCPSDEAFPYTLTPLSLFPYVINCPEGVNCSEALSVTMVCCGTPTTFDIPAGSSPEERAALLQELVRQCNFLNEGCSGGDGPTPAPPTGTQYYLSSARTGQSACTNGDTYNFTLAAGMFMALSQSTANQLAKNDADKRAVRQRFCVNAPSSRCKGVATTVNIDATARVPVTFVLVSGSYPTGLTATQIGGRLQLSGTPTVSGAATFTIKVTDTYGGYVQKAITIYILNIATTSPLPSVAIGTPYSKQLVGEGGTGTYTFDVITGALPAGLTMSASGLISGTPTAGATTFTVRMRDAGLSQTSGGCEKEFTFEAPEGIYYEFGTTAGGIAVDSFGENDTDLNQGARTLVSGPIVSAWLFNSVVPPVEVWFDSSTLSDKTIITTKSITIRFWVKCLEPVTVFQAFHNDVLATRYFSIQITDGALNGAYNKSPDSGTGYGFICYANTDAVDDGNWHRIIFTYDEDTGEARFQVDNNTPTLETVNESLIVENGSIVFTAPAVPDVVAVQLCPYFQIIGSGYPPPYDASGYYAGVYLAEVYVSLGAVWDDADCAYDWNSGAGRTYPDLP